MLYWCIGMTWSGWAQELDDRIVVEPVVFVGNERTQTRILAREMAFQSGDTLSLEVFNRELERSRQNIFNLNLFLTVSSCVEMSVDGHITPVIEVKERLYLLILPIFFLADRNFSEWWYDRGRDLRRTTYGVNAHHDNLSGNNDQLQMRLYGGFVPYFELSYGRPYIDRRQRMGISGGIFVSTQRTMAYRTWNDKLDFFSTEDRMRDRSGAFVRYNLRNGLYHFHTLQANFTATRIADTIAALNPHYFLAAQTQQRVASLTYDYRLDTRDNKQYALQGDVFFAQTTFQYFFKSQLNNLFSLQTGYVKYGAWSKRWFWDASIRVRWSYPTLQPYTQTIGLGFGNNFVRGYELNVIDGQGFGLVKTNIKYKLFNQVFDLSRWIKIRQFNTLPVAGYANLYADAGRVWNDSPEKSNTQLGNSWLLGGGAGLDIISFYNTIGRLNYSFNRQGEGRIYFTVLRGF